MEKAMIRQNLIQANANLEYAENEYNQAKSFFQNGEISKATFDKVCERAINADIALCDAMLIASANGYKVADIDKILLKGMVA
jgi:hypothetical protein